MLLLQILHLPLVLLNKQVGLHHQLFFALVFLLGLYCLLGFLYLLFEDLSVFVGALVAEDFGTAFQV